MQKRVSAIGWSIALLACAACGGKAVIDPGGNAGGRGGSGGIVGLGGGGMGGACDDLLVTVGREFEVNEYRAGGPSSGWPFPNVTLAPSDPPFFEMRACGSNNSLNDCLRVTMLEEPIVGDLHAADVEYTDSGGIVFVGFSSMRLTELGGVDEPAAGNLTAKVDSGVETEQLSVDFRVCRTR